MCDKHLEFLWDIVSVKQVQGQHLKDIKKKIRKLEKLLEIPRGWGLSEAKSFQGKYEA